MFRELASVNLDLSAHETTALFRHAALQAGPNPDGTFLRAAHWVLQENTLLIRMLSQISSCFQSIKANWKETSYMETLIILLTRMLSLSGLRTNDVDLFNAAYDVLLDIRSTTLDWVRTLRSQLSTILDIQSHSKLIVQVLEAAMLCKKTFFISSTEVSDHLSLLELTCFMECSIAIFNTCPQDTSALDIHVRHHLVSDQKLSSAMEPKFSTSIMRTGQALETAIKRDWPGIRALMSGNCSQFPTTVGLLHLRSAAAVQRSSVFTSTFSTDASSSTVCQLGDSH